MKNLKLFLLGLMLCAALPSQAWDRTRHDAIAYIAECNLTPRAKRNIARYLDHSIVYYASWMDKYRDTPEFRNVEHVSYVDAGMQLVDTLRKGKTNCVVELMRAVDRLKDYRNMGDSLVRLNLMYVIHIVGDMHCPSHVKYAGCKSGRADLNGRKMSYHAMWTGVCWTGPMAGVTASINSCWTPSPSARKPPWPRVRPANGCMKPPSRAG